MLCHSGNLFSKCFNELSKQTVLKTGQVLRSKTANTECGQFRGFVELGK